MKFAAMAALLLVVLAGCVYEKINRPFDAAQASALQPGVSTEADAVARLGEPTFVTANPDGTRLLQWRYSDGPVLGAWRVPGQTTESRVAILFDQQRKMIRLAPPGP